MEWIVIHGDIVNKMLKLLLEISILVLFSFHFHRSLLTYDAGREK